MSEPRTPTGRKLVAIHGPALLDDVLGIEAEAGVLDEAWAAAEKALPEGWRIDTLRIGRSYPHESAVEWVVWAEKPDYFLPRDNRTASGTGPTPAAALHALSAALGRSGSGGGRG